MSETGVVDTPGGRFTYLAAGAADAPLALCLHGFPDTPETFVPISTALAAGGWRVVAPWLRGYHPSVLAGPFTTGQLFDDAIALADALSPSRPVALIGHDWGALAVYGAAHARPDRVARAVALAVPHPLAFVANLAHDPAQLKRSAYMALFQVPRLAEWALARDDFALVDKLWRAWSPGFTPPASHLLAVKRCLAANLAGPLGYYRAMARELLTGQRFPRDPIAVPTLHLQGVDDGCIGIAAAAGQDRYFDGRFASELVEQAGHFLHLERPGFVAGRILEWLSGKGA